MILFLENMPILKSVKLNMYTKFKYIYICISLSEYIYCIYLYIRYKSICEYFVYIYYIIKKTYINIIYIHMCNL